jgi:hypothetical protein
LRLIFQDYATAIVAGKDDGARRKRVQGLGSTMGMIAVISASRK